MAGYTNTFNSNLKLQKIYCIKVYTYSPHFNLPKTLRLHTKNLGS